MEDHLARYDYVSGVCRGRRVLDVATGSGYGANIFRKNSADELEWVNVC